MTKDVKTTNKNINSLLCEIDKKVNAMATLTPIIKSESEKNLKMNYNLIY